MLVCNDAWQPALAFLAVQDAARMLIVPANSAAGAYPGALDTRGYWRDITRFYGRMFETYVVFVNRVGIEGDLEFWGGSHVVDACGDLVAGSAPVPSSTCWSATSTSPPCASGGGASRSCARRGWA